MPESAEPLVPRKRPTQERSKRKFHAMLEAARELLIDVGFESLTCEEIATRAEVPIGTLYQYFANKYVIVCELDRQDTVDVREEPTAFSPEVPSLEWPSLLEKFLALPHQFHRIVVYPALKWRFVVEPFMGDRGCSKE